MSKREGVNCLVVDDEPRLRQVLVRLMVGEGFRCDEAANRVEALEKAGGRRLRARAQ